MRIFVAGATGVVGRELLPQLYADGHQVAGTTSHPERADFVRRLGATPVVADALDREAVERAGKGFAPEAIVHRLTGLSGGINPRHQYPSWRGEKASEPPTRQPPVRSDAGLIRVHERATRPLAFPRQQPNEGDERLG